MTINKLESRNDKEAIAEEITILTKLLDDATKTMVGSASLIRLLSLKNYQLKRSIKS